MANTNVFTGMDGSITIAVDDAESPEGQAATAVSDGFGLAPIGRATDVSVSVTSAMRPFHEIGQRYATELRPGNVNVEGTIENKDCGASQGEYKLAVRIKDENRELKSLEFFESWQRQDSEPVRFVAVYSIGENVDLVSVRSVQLGCTCTATPAEQE